jgi:hypothetical protein
MSDQEEQESAFAKMGLQVVDNEAFKQALTVRKAQIFEIFCKTKADQQDVREEAWRTMVNMNALEDFFKKALTTGKMADAALDAMNKKD